MVAKRHSHFGVLFRVFTVIEAVAEPGMDAKDKLKLEALKNSNPVPETEADQTRSDQTRPDQSASPWQNGRDRLQSMQT